MRHFALPEDLRAQLMDYLSTKPLREVLVYFQRLSTLGELPAAATIDPPAPQPQPSYSFVTSQNFPQRSE